jgi:hypothetical protein
MKKLKDIMKNQDANTVLLLVGIAVAILVLAVVFTIGPLVGYNIETSVIIPADGSAAGISQTAQNWNTNHTAVTNGSELWAQNTPMLAVAALIAIVGVIIAILMGVARPN